jgi:hypothetical protein
MATLTPEQELAYQKIRDHLNALCETTPFLKRLAEENSWSDDFARTVVEEYGKFLFIAKTVGHAVSPPPLIDKAWHLHLLNTEDYWERFCPHVLGMTLHHAPHTGDKADDAKFASWTQDTVTTYKTLFGPPPATWAPLDWTRGRTRFKYAAFTFVGMSAGSLFSLIFAPDVWPLVLFAAVGLLIPAIMFFVSARSPLPPAASDSSGSNCGGGDSSGDSGHAGGGHSCGGGGHH